MTLPSFPPSGRFARLTGRQMACESSSRLGLALAKLAALVEIK
jgi:hypothetical protein